MNEEICITIKVDTLTIRDSETGEVLSIEQLTKDE